jgi:hypothetical protein
MWDEADGFYYDVLLRPDESPMPLKVRSMVGLLPLCAATVFEPEQIQSLPRLLDHFRNRLAQMPRLLESIATPGGRYLTEEEHDYAVGGRGLLALVKTHRLRRILARMLDENEFLSPYGIRALSRYHLVHPYIFTASGQEYRVPYMPAESDSGLFGGNSNWRGPIWMPVNAMLIRSLMNLYLWYGDAFKVECPTGSGHLMTLFEVAHEIATRLERIFLRDEKTGRRPVFGGTEKFQSDPHWRDYLLFYEYFHGDNGAGIGASHQTGWTGLVAPLISVFRQFDARTMLQTGRIGSFRRMVSAPTAVAP